MVAELGLVESSTLYWVTLFVSALGARAIYVASIRYRLRFGVTPWRLPSWAWSLLVFLFLPIGVVIFLIARATTRPRSAPQSLAGPALRGGIGAPGGWPGSTTPGSTTPASADNYGLGGSHPPPERLPPAGWYADPAGRHELRYWDGKGWSADVSDGGARSLDPG